MLKTHERHVLESRRIILLRPVSWPNGQCAQSADNYFLIMSLLEYIPVVIIKDPELGFAIFECEPSFIAIKPHNISKKRQEKEKDVVFG